MKSMTDMVPCNSTVRAQHSSEKSRNMYFASVRLSKVLTGALSCKWTVQVLLVLMFHWTSAVLNLR